eukprot:TRINITY_DN18572_c0_g1_i1.p1 TRINITY_DN18572_c0_g1~~TRINITY_DN18572_c0_g1_i1.p1  ORF type:complete len:527 (+),score=37.62 TRINITY_DN18572_c0_g1_i1:117-1583(+)
MAAQMYELAVDGRADNCPATDIVHAIKLACASRLDTNWRTVDEGGWYFPGSLLQSACDPSSFPDASVQQAFGHDLVILCSCSFDKTSSHACAVLMGQPTAVRGVLSAMEQLTTFDRFLRDNFDQVKKDRESFTRQVNCLCEELAQAREGAAQSANRHAEKTAQLDHQLAEARSHLAQKTSSCEEKERQLAVLEGHLAQKTSSCEEKERQLAVLEGLMPHSLELADFLNDIQHLPCSGDLAIVPVRAIRFTHHTVNSDFAFGDSGHDQHSILSLFMDLFTGQAESENFREELHVCKHVGPDGHVGLYSRNNRRLIALLMYQSIRRDSLVRVPCRIHSPDDRSPSPLGHGKTLAAWFRDGYDPADSIQGCNGLGLSIWPRSQRARHRGYPLFRPATTTRRALQRLAERERSDTESPELREETLRALDIVNGALQVRRDEQDGDDETLTLDSQVRPRRNRGTAKGRAWGRSSAWNYWHNRTGDRAGDRAAG